MWPGRITAGDNIGYWTMCAIISLQVTHYHRSFLIINTSLFVHLSIENNKYLPGFKLYVAYWYRHILFAVHASEVARLASNDYIISG